MGVDRRHTTFSGNTSKNQGQNISLAIQAINAKLLGLREDFRILDAWWLETLQERLVLLRERARLEMLKGRRAS